IDPMQIVEIDDVHAEALQARLTARLHAFGSPVHFTRRSAAGRRYQAELGRQDDLAAAIANRAANEDLVPAPAIAVGGVNQRHAEIERALQRARRLFVVAGPVALRHAHATETDRRNGESAGSELSQLHRRKTTLQFAAVRPMTRVIGLLMFAVAVAA